MKKLKTYKQPSIVSGLSINDITNMDIRTFEKLNLSDLQKITGRLVSAANKRIRRMQQAGQRSPALRAYEDQGEVFSTKGKNLNELRHEFTRIREFLGHKTSTLSGWNETKKQTAQSLKDDYGITVDPDDLSELLNLYEQLKLEDPAISEKAFKYEVFKEIAKQISNGKSPAEIAEDLKKRLRDIYKQKEAAYAEFDGFSEFFDGE